MISDNGNIYKVFIAGCISVVGDGYSSKGVGEGSKDGYQVGILLELNTDHDDGILPGYSIR